MSRTKIFLGGEGRNELGSRARMVAVIEKRSLDSIPKDATSLTSWLTTARHVLGEIEASNRGRKDSNQ